MGGSRRRAASTLLIIAGAALLAGALSLFLWNRYEDERAGDAAQEALEQVRGRIAQSEGEAAEMTEVEIDGYLYIGYISIPSLGLDLPVMSTSSYEQLKIAPCRYHGSTKTDDLVIAAHNYERHFGGIKDLEAGDAVYFTDMDGVTTAYEVALVDTLSATAVEEMTSSGYDLTLFTCTLGGQSRVTVRCDRAE